MPKYTYELKKEIIFDYLLGASLTEVSKKYKININTVNGWIIKYKRFRLNGLKTRENNSSYSLQFKLKVIEYKQRSGLTYLEVAKHFNLKEVSIIYAWENKFKGKVSNFLSESEDVVNIGDNMEFNDEYLNNETHLTSEFVTLVFKNENIHEHLKATIA